MLMQPHTAAVTKTRSAFLYLLVLITLSAFSSSSYGIAPGTSTTLSIAPSNSVTAGTAVTLTATVTHSGAPVTTGLVTFCNATIGCPGLGVLGVAQLTSNGTATLNLVLGAGNYNLQAQFNGLHGSLQSVSSQQTLTVMGNSSYQSTTTIAQSGNAGAYTLTSTVTAFGGSLLSGTVSFLDSSNGNFLLGTAELDPATLSHSFTSPAGSPFNVGVGAYFA